MHPTTGSIAPPEVSARRQTVNRRAVRIVHSCCLLAPLHNGEIAVVNELYRLIYYRPLTKLQEGNVFTLVCHSVHRGGACMRGRCAWGFMHTGGVHGKGGMHAGGNMHSKGGGGGRMCGKEGMRSEGGW